MLRDLTHAPSREAGTDLLLALQPELERFAPSPQVERARSLVAAVLRNPAAELKVAEAFFEQARRTQMRGDIDRAQRQFQAGRVLLDRAVDAGEPEAFLMRGRRRLHHAAGDAALMQAGREDLVEAARHGSADAATHLGTSLLLAPSMPVHLAEGLQWLELGAERGDATAALRLAETYDRGAFGTVRDGERATMLYTIAAGDPRESESRTQARFALGERSEHGIAVPRDHVEADRWLVPLALGGHQRAQELLELRQAQPQPAAELQRPQPEPAEPEPAEQAPYSDDEQFVAAARAFIERTGPVAARYTDEQLLAFLGGAP